MRGGLGTAMRYDPGEAPGAPDCRSPTRYLLRLAGQFRTSVSWGIALGVVTLVAQALVPAAIGKAIDSGIAARDQGALLLWGGAVLVLGLVQAVAAILRDRCGLTAQYGATYQTSKLTSRQAAWLGATLPKRVSTGEVLSVGVGDIASLGLVLEVVGRAAGRRCRRRWWP